MLSGTPFSSEGKIPQGAFDAVILVVMGLGLAFCLGTLLFL